MRCFILFLCLFLCLGAVTTVYAVPVQFSGNGNYYEYIIHNDDINWSDAYAAALGRSYLGNQGYLATITSQEENDFLLDLARLNSDEIDTYHQTAWIGGSDDGDDGNWTWRTGPEAGQAFSYENWGTYEPNGGNDENYTRFLWGADGQGYWNDSALEGNWGSGYFVEYNNDSAPVPEPTTLLLFGIGLAGLAGSSRKFKKNQ